MISSKVIFSLKTKNSPKIRQSHKTTAVKNVSQYFSEYFPKYIDFFFNSQLVELWTPLLADSASGGWALSTLLQAEEIEGISTLLVSTCQEKKK